MEFLLPLLITLPAPAAAMIGVAMGLGILIVSLMFMVAYALSNPQLIALAREELAALIFTAFILLFWLTSDAILNGISNGLVASSLPSELGGFASSSSLQGLTISHLDLALASLNIMEQKLKSQYLDLFLFEALIGFLSTISFPLGSPVPAVNIISFSLAPFTGLVLLSNAHTVVVEAIGLLVTVVWAKEFILIFARDTIPILLLPFGLVMRAVPFYRRTGSSVIAVAFAMYFVMPFAVILSNYLIFDIYKPADFSYTPATASYMGSDRDYEYFRQSGEDGREGHHTHELLNQFTSRSLVEESSNDASDECAGNSLVRMMCSVGNIITSAFEAIGGFLRTVWNIWRFMVGMTGDFFFSGFNNPMMPSSASAGLYYFIIQEVTIISPFIILVMLSTVLEIIITVTTYRSVSLLIGGEAELIGITKVV